MPEKIVKQVIFEFETDSKRTQNGSIWTFFKLSGVGREGFVGMGGVVREKKITTLCEESQREKKLVLKRLARGPKGSPEFCGTFGGSAGRFCRMFHIATSLFKKGSAEPQKFCRTFPAKASFSGPANSSPKVTTLREESQVRGGIKARCQGLLWGQNKSLLSHLKPL